MVATACNPRMAEDLEFKVGLGALDRIKSEMPTLRFKTVRTPKWSSLGSRKVSGLFCPYLQG